MCICENIQGKSLIDVRNVNRSFTVKSTVLKHMRTHIGEKPYICTEFEKAFSRV